MTMCVRWVAMATAVLAPVGGGVAQAPEGFDEAWRDVREVFTGTLEREGIVGGSLAFVSGGRLLALETFGLADLETARSVDEGTIYHWASITKTFTGIAVMQLRDRGLLDLDDPIVRYLPELRRVHNPFGSMEDITLRHLMSHSAGFRGATWPWGGGAPWHPHEPTEWEQLVAMLPYTEILFEPGSRYQYSNPGIVFLGRAIEVITGEPYETYVDKNVLRPLGMSRSYFDRTPYHLLAHRSNNYYVTGGEIEANGLDFDTGITVSNGGLNAPVTDMAAYLGLLAGARPDAAGEAVPVVSPASLREMWEPLHEVPEDGPVASWMGLTFFVLEHEGLRVIGHTGGQKGFVSFFYLDPESGAGAVAAFNTLGLRGEGGDGVDAPPRPDTRRVLADLRLKLLREVFPLFAGARR